MVGSCAQGNISKRSVMKSIYSNITILILSIFLLSGCLPTIFAGAASSTLEFAKDRPAGDTLTDIRISTAIKGAFIKNNSYF